MHPNAGDLRRKEEEEEEKKEEGKGEIADRQRGPFFPLIHIRCSPLTHRLFFFLWHQATPPYPTLPHSLTNKVTNKQTNKLGKTVYDKATNRKRLDIGVEEAQTGER